MDYEKTPWWGVSLCLIVLFLLLVVFIIYKYSSLQKQYHPEGFDLPYEVNETIKWDYLECKDINRSKPINRLFKDNYVLPMCPKNPVALFDMRQEILFIYNEDDVEKKGISIFSLSVSAINLNASNS